MLRRLSTWYVLMPSSIRDQSENIQLSEVKKSREKLKRSYLRARKMAIRIRIELNRSRVIILDEDGQMVQPELLRDH
ncbi:hypothetical protein VA7868_03282 [Vibrio aerogenes CECT 7868]|uniref:Uncharacterized protein n=1 Tax=Vibrio aerogenes CECT 7868 TaxID=1216006 RepID=A0A1M5ZUX2_9VIBR|nr:hypothetical protein [Vibrio aerogenes]SHI28087.1 hypothetical protein VA7868_03282 [Vibrio aerogenes CECT 7868]